MSTSPLRLALHDAADQVCDKLDRMDRKLDMILENQAEAAAADRAELNGLHAPKPAKPRTNGHAGGRS
ncbi:hypothetical protein [Acidiphilium acidophilum]|uniref:Uncharacterized protein n=1 Tax=Acidiphilium acidophilum TaxID=76588 RepID=A0AAW9DS81_ACIAO|nr:hypothetical protein [Acidiphilium acidophilum]MDX5931575.1 hypothetical protein [Acidiphilium acidophilum]